eukprot:TRINITY_DN102746_c0_g1_i1.p1 TRINITY_DN102746_c0_g1~~TRINITY_DN102746_c0_g1_i1.p1  ORF type:complete len:114 (-),score=17.20 TRINITY_DN102746_c0_g1_i1:54-395(-)
MVSRRPLLFVLCSLVAGCALAACCHALSGDVCTTFVRGTGSVTAARQVLLRGGTFRVVPPAQAGAEAGGSTDEPAAATKTPEERTFGNPLIRLLMAMSLGLALNIFVRSQMGM